MFGDDVESQQKLPLTLGDGRTGFKREFMIRKFKTSKNYKDMAQRRMLDMACKIQDDISYPETPKNVGDLPKAKWEKQFRLWKLAVNTFPNHEKITLCKENYNTANTTEGVFQWL